MNESDQTTPLEVMQPSAVEALERASIDVQVATAHRFPRTMEQFKKRALAMVTMDFDTAESCIYVRPVGKEKNEKGVWVEKYAEGPSVRLAEIVSTSFGNIRIAARIIEQTERYVKCEGVAHDLESNAAGKAEVVESTVTKEGKPYSERQRALIAKVCISKAYRDAVFRIVPRALCKPMLEAAKRIINGGDQPLSERIKRVAAWLISKKVDDARLFAAMNVQGWADITPEHLNIITGLKTAISEGDVTLEEAFPPIQKQESTGTAGPPNPPPPPTAGQGSKPPQEQKPPAQTPPQGQKPAEKGTSEQPKGVETTTTTTPPPGNQVVTPPQPSETPEDQKQLADAGLAPQQKTDEPLPEFVPRQGATDALNNVLYLLHKARKTEAQLLVELRKRGLAKDGQKVGELSEAKLKNIGKVFDTEFAPNI